MYSKISQHTIRDTHVYMTLFTISRLWTQPRCPSIDEWRNKMRYIYTMVFYSAIKKILIMLYSGEWIFSVICGI
jgi:hypothetical protein